MLEFQLSTQCSLWNVAESYLNPSAGFGFLFSPHLALQIPDTRFDQVIHLSIHHLCNLSPFFTIALLILKVRITLPTGQSASFSITHINFLSYSRLLVGFDLACVASTDRVKSGDENEKNWEFKMARIWRLVAIFICSYNLMTSQCLNHCSSDQYAVAIKMNRMTEGRMGQ